MLSTIVALWIFSVLIALPATLGIRRNQHKYGVGKKIDLVSAIILGTLLAPMSIGLTLADIHTHPKK